MPPRGLEDYPMTTMLVHPGSCQVRSSLEVKARTAENRSSGREAGGPERVTLCLECSWVL